MPFISVDVWNYALQRLSDKLSVAIHVSHSPPGIGARASASDGEADVARIEAWLEAAVTAAAIDDVFRDG